MSPRALAAAALLGLSLAACDPKLPDPPPAAPRVQQVEPSGEGVSPALATVSVTFSAPVSPAGLTDGSRLVLAPATVERAAVSAVESDGGAADLDEAVPSEVMLEEGGRRAVLRPRAPLHPLVPYVVVVSSHLASPSGQAVLDADGKKKPTVGSFTTGAIAGPAAEPVIAQLRTDADSPEAGGEYVVLANAGEGPLDLFGWRLEKRGTTGSVSVCALGEGQVAAGGLALVVGGAYDQRYTVPQGTAVVRCATASLLGGLADDRFPSLRLLDPLGRARSTAGAAGGPVCAIAMRIDLAGADDRDNWRCVDTD